MIAVGVVGGSARAAVQSLARAGFAAWAVDQFADRDVKLHADYAKCPADRFPEAIPKLADQFPTGPVLYTGALENHPKVIHELTSRRELWGNSPDVLTRVRDPFALAAVLVEAGFSAPDLVPPGTACPDQGIWLRKPIRSAGGLGIRTAQPGEAPSSLHYFQEYRAGVSMSALYFDETLFGISEQLIGQAWVNARPYSYCGNLGPAWVPTRTRATLERLGQELAHWGELRGPWGIDFILDNDVPRPVELNPRYTAAVEVIEYATGVALFQQSEAKRTDSTRGSGGSSHPARPARAEKGQPTGKAIYFAGHRMTFPKRGPWDLDLERAFDPWRIPWFADIPEPGTDIEPGMPVLTFFATGATAAAVRERLLARAAELSQLFMGSRT